MDTNYMTETTSALYAKWRPSPPQKYLDTIVAYVNEKIPGPLKKAVDVGCGTGQCTLFLSPHFQHVLGLDMSSAQIEVAKRSAEHLTNVEFGVSGAESLPVESGTIQLITAATCLHYFEVDKFYAEARRVLAPNGVVAVSSMCLPVLKHDDSAVERKINEHLKEFTDFLKESMDYPGTDMVWNLYRDVKLPFSDTRRVDDIWTSLKCSVAYFKFYLSSWFSFQVIVKKQGKEACEKALSTLTEKLMETLKSGKPDEETAMEVLHQYIILLGRKSDHE